MQLESAAPSVSLAGLTPKALVALLGLGVIFAIALMPVTWAAFVIFGLAVVTITVIRLDYALYILVFAIPLGIPFSSVIAEKSGNLPMAAGEILVPVLLLSWLARVLARRRNTISFHALMWPVLILVGFLVYSATIAASLPLGLKEVSRWLELVVVFVIATNEIRTGQQVKTLLIVLLLAGLAEALLGWYQFFTGYGPAGFLLGGRFLRAYGTFKQPNPYAGYLGLVIPVAYGVVLTVWHNAPSSLRSHLRLVVIALSVLVVALAMSSSRGAWLAAFGAFCVVSVYRSRRFVLPIVFAVSLLATLILLGFTGLLPTQIKGRLEPAAQYFTVFNAREAVVTSGNWSIVERMAIWQAAWEMFQGHRVLGIGAGNFKERYPDYALPRWQYEAPHAHNYYLNVLAETGIVGLAIYSVVLISMLSYVWRSLRSLWRLPLFPLSGPGDWMTAQGITLGIFGALLALSLHNLFDNMYVRGMTVQVGLMLALVVVTRRLVEAK